jgi:rSAM/selenodomain-associated transferase 1
MKIQVFGRTPVPGRVKTRLHSRLGADGAARLHARLLNRVLQTCLKSRLAPVELWLAGELEHPSLDAVPWARRVPKHRQQGMDLGQRMDYALRHGARRGQGVILVGSDCPALTVAHLYQACLALQRGHRVSLIPAEDGGYVLIGARGSHWRLFQGVPWGSDAVFEETRRRLRSIHWSWHQQPSLWDLDRPADLDRLPAALLED